MTSDSLAKSFQQITEAAQYQSQSVELTILSKLGKIKKTSAHSISVFPLVGTIAGPSLLALPVMRARTHNHKAQRRFHEQWIATGVASVAKAIAAHLPSDETMDVQQPQMEATSARWIIQEGEDEAR